MFILDVSLSNVVSYILAAIKLKFLIFCWRLLYLPYFQCVLREPSESKRAKVLNVFVFNKSIKFFPFKRANKMLKVLLKTTKGACQEHFYKQIEMNL